MIDSTDMAMVDTATSLSRDFRCWPKELHYQRKEIGRGNQIVTKPSIGKLSNQTVTKVLNPQLDLMSSAPKCF
jgi:hypothetical protein